MQARDLGAAKTATAIRGGVRNAIAHDSAAKHVAGTAIYIDDMPEPAGTLHAAPGLSASAHARIKSIDLAKVRAAPGVVLVLAAADIRGVNDVSPIGAGDDPVFAADKVEFHGQVLFAVIAESHEAARRAAKLAKVEYEDLSPILTIDEALREKLFVLPKHVMKRGDAASSIARAPHYLKGVFRHGGQEHFYLEGQVSLAIPAEDGDVIVHCSTQHPSEVQHNVAHVLGRPNNAVTVECRRMGGGFGGKETQGAQWAAIAALAAVKLKRPVKCRLDRDDDMITTGKRHDFRIEYEVGFDNQGRILGIAFNQAARCGYSADLSGAIADRAMFHADNGYYLESVRIQSHRCKTHTVSNTAFRGFGGPQGMMGIEEVMDVIARHRGLDPLDVRRVNLYGDAPRNVTPYHMVVEDNILPELITQLEKSADYRGRRKAITQFNRQNAYLKKGIALT
ncbi:MAG: molybdopterin cofactor-binding domain-containing protein, partial [Dongiaceae bacterium]